MGLTDVACRKAIPKDKLYRLYDSGGLFLMVLPSGAKRWQWRYKYNKKEARKSLGSYPAVSLREARQRRDELKNKLNDGINPARSAIDRTGGTSFAAVAEKWINRLSSMCVDTHINTVRQRLDSYILPAIGDIDIKQVTPHDILNIIDKLELRKTYETARRVRGVISQVYDFAIIKRLADINPAAGLKHAVTPTRTKHYPTIVDPAAIGRLLADMDNLNGSIIVKAALQLAPLVFVRPGELRRAEWSEININEALWRIPAEKMKMRQPHIVPLSTQAIDILTDIKQITGVSRYVFPSVRTFSRPISDGTINVALRRLGYDSNTIVAHGFRAMASTLLNENGFRPDLIEKQLAHTEKDGVRAAYNRAQYLLERRQMMQWWGDFLQKLKQSAIDERNDI